MSLKDVLMQDERHLPANRKELFFDKLFVRFGFFLKMGISLFLFCLPYFILMVIKDIFFIYMGDIVPEQEIDAFARSYGFLFDLGGVVLLVPAALGLAGTFRIIRQFAWGNGCFFVSDFKTGIRTNGKFFSVFGIMTGIFLTLNNLNLLASTETSVSALTLMPVFLAVLFLIPVMLLCFAQITVYNTTLAGSLRDCIWLYGRTLPKTLPAALVMELPLLLVFISVPHTKYEATVVFAIVILPVMLFGWFLYCCGVFDKYINAKSYPELVDKGLFKEKQRY